MKKIIPLLLLLLLLFTGAAAEEYAIYESTTMGYRIPYPAHWNLLAKDGPPGNSAVKRCPQAWTPKCWQPIRQSWNPATW